MFVVAVLSGGLVYVLEAERVVHIQWGSKDFDILSKRTSSDWAAEKDGKGGYLLHYK